MFGCLLNFSNDHEAGRLSILVRFACQAPLLAMGGTRQTLRIHHMHEVWESIQIAIKIQRVLLGLPSGWEVAQNQMDG